MNARCFQNYWHLRQQAFSDIHYFFIIVFIIHALFIEVKGNNHRMARRRDKKDRGNEEGKKGGRK